MAIFDQLLAGLNIINLEKAVQLIEANQFQQAEQLLREALKTNPVEPRVVYLLSQLAIKGGAYQQAMVFLKQHLALAGESKEVLLQLAQVQAEQELIHEASQSYSQLVKLFPGWSAGLFGYAGFLQSKGHFQQVKPLLRKVILLEPKHCGAFLALSNLVKFDADNPLLSQMEQLLLEFSNSKQPLQQMQLSYALGKAYDDLGLYQQAFESWTKANQIQLAGCQFRVSQMKPFLQQLMNSFELVANKSLDHTKTEEQHRVVPIFIVGLPRTGSTLLEQMLNRHDLVSTAGESNAVPSIIAAGIQKVTHQTFPAGMNELTSLQWQSLGESYLNVLQNSYGESRFVIDKLPANFQSIGLIKKAIPQAVIIHMTREPQAVALSVFKNYFSANEPYFCDLKEFIDYRKLYLKMMAFWNKYYRDSIIEISYEQLINDPEIELRRVLNKSGLEWQPKCLDFHTDRSPVKTLSNTQVRQPLYQSSLDAWHKYAHYLSEFEWE